MQQTFIDFLQLYRHIPPEDAARIADGLEYSEVVNGEVLLHPGSYVNRIYFILDGILKIVVVNEKGSTVTHYFIKENQFCTILKSFNDGTLAAEGIEAVTNARVVYFDKITLNRLYDEIHYFRELLAGIMQEMLLYKINTRNAYLGLDAAGRYHKFLSNQSDIALRVPLGDVASYLGITQQSLSRIRKGKP